MRSCGRFAFDAQRVRRAMDSLCDSVRHGLSAEEAERIAGVTRMTRTRWLRRGDAGEEMFAAFAAAYRAAQIEARTVRVRAALKAA